MNRELKMNGELESLMRDVGRAVEGEAQRQNILPQVQARLAARATGGPARRAVRWGFALAGVAACTAAALIYLRPQAISYAVSGVGEGEVGAPLVAPAVAPLELRFSDGSAVTLPPRAAAHVDALSKDGATVAIEEGTLEVSVIHRAHTRWQVQAGGYRIQVTGTRFAAGWDRKSGALTVTMHEGAVLVTGPGLKEPVRVVTGQRLRASASGADLGLESAPPAPAAAEPSPALPVASARGAEPALAPPPTEIAPPAERASAPRARRVEAVAVATHAGAPPGPTGASRRRARSTAKPSPRRCSKGGGPSARDSAPTIWCCSATWPVWRAISTARKRPIGRRAGASPRLTGRSMRSVSSPSKGATTTRWRASCSPAICARSRAARWRARRPVA